jgi:Domain of unknown function (DUF4383)
MVTAGRSAVATRSPVRAVTLLFGAVFLLIGVAGFIPGVTSHYGDLGFAGDESGAEILGLFQTSVLHNVVHLLFGVVAVAMARTETGARTYLVGAGTAYLVLWVFGLVVHGQKGNFIPVNNEDNWLHLGLALALTGLGLLLPESRPARGGAAPR